MNTTIEQFKRYDYSLYVYDIDEHNSYILEYEMDNCCFSLLKGDKEEIETWELIGEFDTIEEFEEAWKQIESQLNS